MKRAILLFVTLAIAGVALAQSTAAPQGKLEGKYRIQLMNGKYVEGDVKELADGSYEVRTKQGAIVTVRKNQVKGVMPLEDTQVRKGDAPGSAGERLKTYRREISKEEIESVLAGITAEYEEGVVPGMGGLAAELPLNEAGLAEMKRLVGADAKVLLRPHFVMVYTASDDSARALGSRLESVWRNNMKFMKILGLKPVPPEHKLEVIYFGTYKEFEAYSLNEATALPPGVLGYYSHLSNRSHFFDLWDMPMFQGVKEMLKEPRLPYDRRQIFRNWINRWVEFHNLEVIQHEAGHHIHFNTGVFQRRGEDGGSAPTWLVEGTTMLFEVPPPTSGRGGSGLGDRNDARLNELREHFPKFTASEFKHFVLNNMAWYQGYNYPRGWAIVYYLYTKHRKGFGDYIRRIYEREPGEELSYTELEKEFEDCFGQVNDKWIADFYKFLDSLPVRPSRLPPDLSAGPPSGGRGGSSGRSGRPPG